MHTEDREQNRVVIRSANIVLTPSTKSVFIDDQAIEIKGLNYLFLQALLLSEQKLLSYEELAIKVWGKQEVSYEVMAQRASLVRKAIGDKDKQRFESVRGQGYQWLPEIEIEPIGHIEANVQSTARVKATYLATIVISITLTIIAAYFVLTKGGADKNDLPPVSNHNSTNAKPLQLERAEYYASQHTNSANRIALDLYKSEINNSAATAQILFNYSGLLIERVAKFERDPALLEEASRAIEQLKQYDMDNLAINWLQGYYFDVLGDIDRAITFYEKSLSMQELPLARSAGSLAYLYTQKGKLFEATSLNISSLHGRGSYRLLQLAEIFYLIELEPEAQQWIESAYQLAPNDGFSALQYAKYLYVNGEYEKAKNILHSFHTLTDKTSASLTCLALLNIHFGNHDLAKSLLTQALEVEPRALRTQAMLYWLNKTNFETNTISSPPQLAANTSWPQDYVTLSIFHLSNGNQQFALEALSQAYQLGFVDYKYLNRLPFFSELQSIPEYSQLVKEMQRSVMAERAKIQLTELPNLSQLLQAK